MLKKGEKVKNFHLGGPNRLMLSDGTKTNSVSLNAFLKNIGLKLCLSISLWNELTKLRIKSSEYNIPKTNFYENLGVLIVFGYVICIFYFKQWLMRPKNTIFCL